MSSKQAYRPKYESATWKIGKNFRHQQRICAEITGYPERLPCVTIKR